MAETATAEMPDDFNDRLHDRQLLDSYDGVMSASASHRSFINIEPNISVRPEMNRRDYDRFRPGESIPGRSKSAIHMCMEAYSHVGIIKNTIDLMGDFGSQGITITHPNKKEQKFYRSWCKAVKFVERSERFLNTLYRCGNVIMVRRYAKLSKKLRQEMAKAADILEIEKNTTYKNTVPYRYDILNPCQVSVKGEDAGIFFGKPIYELDVSKLKSSDVKKYASVLGTLPESLQKALKEGATRLPLDPENLIVYHYKKDDWQLWAYPMIYAILDDLVMFEKMKLADMAALDGAISNIRLWNLGDLENKIMPSPAAINKLRNILASHTGGGPMDLVWGPELKFTESNTQIYKFLGEQKYGPILNCIYAGLGIPPTLTGLAGQSGGYTNNYISLKTLIDRLEYGRELLRDFWTKELKLVQKAMGFKTAPKIHFDDILSADEDAAKNLLISMADRGIISLETLRERLGEDHELETSRTVIEFNNHKDKKVPPRKGPYDNGELEGELMKIALQKGLVGIQDVSDINPKHALPVNDFTPQKPNGRPPFSKDTKPRKQKTVKPKTKPSMTKAILWATTAQRTIAEMILPPLLEYYKKDNLRDLTKEERKDINDICISILSNMEIGEITEEKLLAANKNINPVFSAKLDRLLSNFMAENSISPSLEEMRQLISIAYALTFCK